MFRTRQILFWALALALMSASAFGYDFWGITIGTQTYAGSTQLAFDGVDGTGIQFVVGGYEYTGVDSMWYGPFPAAFPGEGFFVHRKSDAQGLFFKPEASVARFMIITGTPQTGVPAPECGYGSRLFGPGDLKIDVGGTTYGIGLRLDNLLWAVDPLTTDPKYKIHRATGGTDDIRARDAGTLGRIECNPRWDRVDHPDLPAGSEAAYAFFVKNSGTLVGSASVTYEPTGLSISGAGIYACEVAVPWALIGVDPSNYQFRASWRPDCGNDLIAADFRGEYYVPEPGGMLALSCGLIGLAARRRRR